MVHPATRRVVKAAIDALGVPLDIGFVFPPKPGEARGFGQWTNRDLTPGEVMALMPRAAAANARGGNVYLRLGPSARANHPGVVLLDDLTAMAVEQLSQDGFQPCLVVETSPGNFQAWVRLAADCYSVPYSAMGAAARYMAERYGGDPRAVSPRQPGRMPGFTNRKAKHQFATGAFPYVRLTLAEPARLASAGPWLTNQLTTTTDTGRAGAAGPETPRSAAEQSTQPDSKVMAQLDAIHLRHLTRIQGEAAEGRRPSTAASLSEVDFALARAAQRAGISPEHIKRWLVINRVEKDARYADQTLRAANTWKPSM
jgi:hypothetical protein